jgi:hypothetical protein
MDVKLRRMRWTMYVARLEQMVNEYIILLRECERKRQMGDFSVDGRLLFD